MGLPTIIIALADNQKPVTEWLSKKGAAVNLGWHINVSPGEIEENLRSLLCDKERLADISLRGKELVDGEGVARTLMHIKGERLRLRPVCEEDCKLIWEWANDDETRRASFSQSFIPWDEHIEWFNKKLNDPDHLFFILINDEEKEVGQIRYSIEGERAVVSCSVAPDYRNLGYGSEGLRIGTKKLFHERQVQKIDAFVKVDNLISLKTFQKVGFKKIADCFVNGMKSHHLVLLRSDLHEIN